MTSAEASAALERYQRAYPGAWDHLRQAIEKAVGHPVDQLPMVELLLDLAPAGADRVPCQNWHNGSELVFSELVRPLSGTR
jgi:hypothetical protein